MTNKSWSSKPVAISVGTALDALEGVIGYKTPKSFFKGTVVAEKLGLDPTVWSAKRKGKRTSPTEAELSKLIDIYGLGEFGLDFRIFRSPTEEVFLAQLQQVGVGTYGPNASRKFRQFLYNVAQQQKKYRVGLIGINEPFRRGGIGFGSSENTKETTIKIGGTVRILCEGPTKHHLVVLNERLNRDITILAPSLRVPLIYHDESTIVLPTSVDWESFEIHGPPGHYRLFAMWTTIEIASVVSNVVDVNDPFPSELRDETMAKLNQLLDIQEKPIEVALHEYIVERS